ncbi:hypothetical protein [Chitinimonas lacunae]|uniref:Uncharacterized protein n=1 Tax=Chitinimonas lacunae TaxID=1963018 RepID=A0ABV8MMN2_9NEIS
MSRYHARFRAELEWRRQRTFGYWVGQPLKWLRAVALPAWS